MKFSILLSLYIKESPENLDECMQSIIINQTIQPSEIVIVEDGTLTPELYQVLEYWTNKLPEKIIRVRLPQNVGLGNALNEGLMHCSNDWVFRMDTDDISTPNRFEKQVEFIKANPNIDIFSGQVIEFDGSIDNIIGKKEVPISHQQIIKYAQSRNPFNHMAVAYKKSAVLAVGGYQHHIFMEDYNLWLRILSSNYSSANLAETLVLVRAGKNMIKRRRGKIYIKSEWQLHRVKQELKFQPYTSSILLFIVRSLTRALPENILIRLYKTMRRRDASQHLNS